MCSFTCRAYISNPIRSTNRIHDIIPNVSFCNVYIGVVVDRHLPPPPLFSQVIFNLFMLSLSHGIHFVRFFFFFSILQIDNILIGMFLYLYNISAESHRKVVVVQEMFYTYVCMYYCIRIAKYACKIWK